MSEARSKEEYIAYRLESAREALREARILMSNDGMDGATNRAYYCMFHGVSALAARAGHSGKTHKALIQWFHQQFVHTAVFDKQLGKDLNTAFIRRGEADYSDFINPDKEIVTQLIYRAEVFLEAIENLIKIKE